ncbi:MAG: DNA topoisomerase (ATP-hydrolyzing) subunit B [Actinomycetes bacterium]
MAGGCTELSYDASAITVLEGLDAVRKRPGMYIGSTGERGLHHLVYEVVDNSVDEALAGECDQIDITILADGGVRVIDNGRGIPVDLHPIEKRPAVEIVMTVLHSGGKFGGSGYSVSGGLHGVGISVVNALSRRLDVEVHREGRVWRQTYERGVPVADLVAGEATDHTGTTITFWADPEIFETTVYETSTLTRRFQEMAFLNRGLTIALTDERPIVIPEDTADETEIPVRSFRYYYEGGIADFVRHLNASKGAANPTIIHFGAEEPDRHISAEVAMQWNSGYSESVYTFANTINTHEGGAHEEGFRTALTTLVNKFARDWGVLKEKDVNLSGEDVREGLTAIVSVKLAEPQFEGQTKTKLGNTEAKTYVQKVCNEQLGAWFEQNPAEGKEIARKSAAAATARIAARKARDLARSRKGLLGGGGLPGKLQDCSSNNPEECEVYIVEGDSAGGSARQGRDPRTQAILPIRGKILNVEKARIDRVLQNNEVQALISALGTGVHDDFDMAKLRYHKIVLMADADVDGQHIRTLLLTLLFRFMRPLIENGYVYLAQPPLYKIKWSRSEPQFAYSDRERDALMAAGATSGRKLGRDDIQRYKGLGEMNHDELWETTMDPARRTLLQITLDDAVQADEIFTVLMGEDVESRRAFIQQNARDVRFLDI